MTQRCLEEVFQAAERYIPGEPGVRTEDIAHLLQGKAGGITSPAANTDQGSLPPRKRRAVPALLRSRGASEILYWKIIAVYYVGDSTADEQ